MFIQTIYTVQILQACFINNNSYFYDNSFYNASIYSGTLNLSDIDNCTLINTGLANFTLDGSVITELNQYNVPGSLSFELKNLEHVGLLLLKYHCL
jgi:hypothetical protein